MQSDCQNWRHDVVALDTAQPSMEAMTQAVMRPTLVAETYIIDEWALYDFTVKVSLSAA